MGHGAWLCVSPQRAGVKQPPFTYLGLDGRGFTPGESPYEDLRRHEAAVREGAVVPALWPAQALEQPIFCGWEGPRERATGLVFVGGDWVVSIRQGARERGDEADGTEEHGTVDGRPVAFDLEKTREGWVASTTTDGFTAVVECRDAWFGLDLVRRCSP